MNQGTGVCDYICRNKRLHDCDVTESLMQTVFNYYNEDGWVSVSLDFNFLHPRKWMNLNPLSAQ